MVTVHLGSTYADAIGEASLTVLVTGETTVLDLLAEIAETHPAIQPLWFRSNGQLRGHVEVAVNGTAIQELQGPDTVIQSDAELTVKPALGC
ncbi:MULTISPECIES: MoaD/ThiS family protein [unclassified Haladaptatus]|uniref:MoaD/ThiS family protein n=1 Tax=unclassified Haladaptatus TaxID=2622732 RepID=UPI002FCDE550